MSKNPATLLNQTGNVSSDVNAITNLTQAKAINPPARIASGSGQLIHLGQYTINHTTGTRSLFEGTTAGALAAGNSFAVPEDMTIKQVTVKTNMVDANLPTNPAGAAYIGWGQGNGSGTLFSQVSAGNFMKYHATFSPHITKLHSLLPVEGGAHVYHETPMSFPVIPKWNAFYYVGIDIPASVATKSYIFDVWIEVEFL